MAATIIRKPSDAGAVSLWSKLVCLKATSTLEKLMFTDCYATQFRRSSNALTRIYDDALRPVGIRITQFSLLRGLARLGDASVTQLAQEACLDRTTMSRNMKLLIEAGWVDVIPASTDKREKVLHINAKGHLVIKRAMRYWARAQKRIEEHTANFAEKPSHGRLLEALEMLQRASDVR